MNEDTLLQQCEQHLDDARSAIEERSSEWDDYEAILINRLTDKLSGESDSQVFDPILSTIVYERSARVMAQNPKGKAYATSKDDIGKNALMNLLLKYYYKNANEQDSMLIKLRLWDLYSLVYGTMFALVPWRVKEDGYIGPELNILPIRDCFPQPTKRNVNDMDWFIVRSSVSIEWLEQQDPKVWKNVSALKNSMKSANDKGDSDTPTEDGDKSFVERELGNSIKGDGAFPSVEIYTEYRRDMWITWTPNRVNEKTSEPFILREVKNPYPGNMLPVVAKHAFPLLDSPIGIGEFARGKTLQLAANSIWNLHLLGTKYKVFPPLHVNPDNVTASSMVWAPGEFWFMDNPNADVQAMRMDQSGQNVFFETFGAIKSAIESQAGTSAVRESSSQRSSIGKTPEAIRFMSNKESARDEWDRVMMEQAITDVYERWIALTVANLEKGVQMRLFAEEIEDIKEVHPDVVTMFDSNKRGEVSIDKSKIDGTYDFVLETTSTLKTDPEEEQNNLTSILKAVIENPTIVEALAKDNKSINIGELFKRWVIAGGLKDHEKIIVENEPLNAEGTEIQQAEPSEQDLMAMMGGQPAPQQAPQQAINPQDFTDPAIQQAVMEMMGGSSGVPRQ